MKPTVYMPYALQLQIAEDDSMPDGPDNVDDLSQDLSAISADDCKVSSDQYNNEAFATYFYVFTYLLTTARRRCRSRRARVPRAALTAARPPRRLPGRRWRRRSPPRRHLSSYLPTYPSLCSLYLYLSLYRRLYLYLSLSILITIYQSIQAGVAGGPGHGQGEPNADSLRSGSIHVHAHDMHMCM